MFGLFTVGFACFNLDVWQFTLVVPFIFTRCMPCVTAPPRDASVELLGPTSILTIYFVDAVHFHAHAVCDGAAEGRVGGFACSNFDFAMLTIYFVGAVHLHAEHNVCDGAAEGRGRA